MIIVYVDVFLSLSGAVIPNHGYVLSVILAPVTTLLYSVLLTVPHNLVVLVLKETGMDQIGQE